MSCSSSQQPERSSQLSSLVCQFATEKPDSSLQPLGATCHSQNISNLGQFHYSARKGENDPNLGDPSSVAANLVHHIVVVPNVLNDKHLHFDTSVHCELNKVRTTTSATHNCSVQGCSYVVNVNTVGASRQQYLCVHYLYQCYKQVRFRSL